MDIDVKLPTHFAKDILYNPSSVKLQRQQLRELLKNTHTKYMRRASQENKQRHNFKILAWIETKR